MKNFLLAAVTAIWAIACFGGYITLGHVILKSPDWWFFGFFITLGVIVLPIIVYDELEGRQK